MVDIKQITSFLGTNHVQKQENTVAKDTNDDQNERKKQKDNQDDLELVAVITAAICALEQVPKDAFVVRSIKRRKQQV